jgi:hypothetical protein
MMHFLYLSYLIKIFKNEIMMTIKVLINSIESLKNAEIITDKNITLIVKLLTFLS